MTFQQQKSRDLKRRSLLIHCFFHLRMFRYKRANVLLTHIEELALELRINRVLDAYYPLTRDLIVTKVKDMLLKRHDEDHTAGLRW